MHTLACVFAMFTNTLAAALSTWMDRRMVAPSFVTLMPPSRLPTDCKILSIPKLMHGVGRKRVACVYCMLAGGLGFVGRAGGAWRGALMYSSCTLSHF